MMTVLLEYIDYSLHFPQTLNIAININLTTSYHAGIMVNVFNDPLCLKLCWHNRRIPICDWILENWPKCYTRPTTLANTATLIYYLCKVALPGLANWSTFSRASFANHVKLRLRHWGLQGAPDGRYGSKTGPSVSEISVRLSRLVWAYNWLLLDTYSYS